MILTLFLLFKLMECVMEKALCFHSLQYLSRSMLVVPPKEEVLIFEKSKRVVMMQYKEEKEAKKEAFRKYLESSGVLDSLTKVLVSLYEQNDKPSSALEFIQQKLGGPSVSEYEKLQAEKSDLQIKYNELFAKHKETLRELERVKSLHTESSSKEDADRDAHEDLVTSHH